MEHTTINNEKLAYKLLKDWLKSIRLCGAFDRLGFDTSDYRPNTIDDLLLLFDIKITEETDLIIVKYEKIIVEMPFFEFMEKGSLGTLATDMVEELFEVKNRTNL